MYQAQICSIEKYFGGPTWSQRYQEADILKYRLYIIELDPSLECKKKEDKN